MAKYVDIKIPEKNEKILSHLKNRITTLVECSGCFITVNQSSP